MPNSDYSIAPNMPLIFGGQQIRIYGGPYAKRPDHLWGVKLAKELDLPCNIDLPIEDYSVPNVKEAKRALSECIKALSQGKELYVGCMGGIGRTGLFLALMAKASGVKNPIEYIRSTYYEHAVETPDQERFVKNFNVFWLKWAYKLSSASAKPKLASTPPFKPL